MTNFTKVESEEQFRSLIANNPSVVVYFSSPYCGVCRDYDANYEELASEKPKVNFAKVDLNNFNNLATEYGARCLPTFLFISQGEVIQKLDGLCESIVARNADMLSKQLEPPYYENGILHIVKEKDFDDTIKSKTKVVVDFYADWCGPCKAITPYIETLAAKHTDVTFMKVNVDEHRKIMSKCDVHAMPTFVFFYNGKMKETVIGGSSYEMEECLLHFDAPTEEYLKKDVLAGSSDEFVTYVKSEEEYNQVLKNNSLVVADYYGDSCGACVAASTPYSKLAFNNQKVKFVKVDTSKLYSITAKERVSCLPTFKLFHNGKEIKKLEGFSQKELETAIKNLVAKESSSTPTKTTTTNSTTVNKTPTTHATTTTKTTTTTTQKSVSPTKSRTTTPSSTLGTKKPTSVTKSPYSSPSKKTTTTATTKSVSPTKRSTGSTPSSVLGVRSTTASKSPLRSKPAQ